MIALKSVFAERVDDTPTDDQIVVLEGVEWSDFERILEIRGDWPVPRLTYLKGRLELMSPSRTHESVKGRLGCLVEVYCLRAGIDFETLGSWTLKDRRKKRGVEPDECYVFGVEPDRKRPHLAIEVVWTSGGIDKLDVYRKLDVQEVWFWRLGKLTIHALRGDRYSEVSVSEVLPAIDLTLLGSFIDRPTTSQSMRDYGAALDALRAAT